MTLKNVCKYKIINLAIPKPLTTGKNYTRSPDVTVPEFHGFCWKFANVFSGVSRWNSRTRIFEENFTDGFSVIGAKSFPDENPRFYGLTFLHGYWTCDSTKIISVSPSTGQIEGTSELAYELADLTTDGNNLWAATRGNKILQFGKHPSMLYQEHTILCSELGGIAWDGSRIWTSDIEENLVYRLNNKMEIIATYRLVFIDEFKRSQIIKSISYLTFDFNGYLWAGDGKMLYKFGNE